MDGKAAGAALLALLLLQGLAQFVPMRGSTASLSSQAELGFGPTTLMPVTDSVPVYTFNDQMWVASSSNETTTFRLYAPANPLNFTAEVVLPPYGFAPIYTFGKSDAPGLWQVIGTQGSTEFVVVPVSLVAPVVLPNPALTGARILSNATMVASYTEDAGGAYSMQACPAPYSYSSVTFTLPAQVGSGSITLGLQNGTVTADMIGNLAKGSNSFDFWFQLYYPFPYQGPGGPADLITGDSLAGESQPTVFIGSNSTEYASLPLTSYVQPREGRYTVRAFFRNSAGLFSEETTALVFGALDSWFWLGACTPLADVNSSFSMNVPRGETFIITQPGLEYLGVAWPNHFYLMYRDEGIESFIDAPILANVTSVDLSIEPWGGGLPQGFTLSMNSSPDVTGSQTYNLTTYVESSRIPANASLELNFAGRPFQNFTAVINQEYGSLAWTVELARADVSVDLDSSPLSGALVKIIDSNSKVVLTRSFDGSTTFYLPGGNYTAEAVYGNETMTEAFSVAAGSQTAVALGFQSAPDYTVVYILIATAVAGAVAGSWVWGGILRRRQ